ncbi:MAG: hypothetical protein AAF467_00455 [Actinomycetota bacterium]
MSQAITIRLAAAFAIATLLTGACSTAAEDPLAVAPADTTADSATGGGSSVPVPDDDRELALADDASADGGDAVAADDAVSKAYCDALEAFTDATDASMDTEHVDWPADIQAYADVIEAAAAEAPPASATALDGFAALTREAATMTHDEFLANEEFGSRYIGYLFGEMAVVEADADSCDLDSGGGSVTVTQEDIEQAQGWVDATGQVTAACVVIDDETYTVDLTNTGDDLADYELAVTFTYADGSENTEAAASQQVTALRPKERTIEQGWSLFDGTGDSCAVTQVRRAPTLNSADLPEPQDRCTVIGRDEFDHLDFEVEVIATQNGDVWPTVAFIDEEGVRRATHMGSAEGLTAGEVATVADTNISSVSDPTVVECEVVSRLNW